MDYILSSFRSKAGPKRRICVKVVISKHAHTYYAFFASSDVSLVINGLRVRYLETFENFLSGLRPNKVHSVMKVQLATYLICMYHD